MALTEDAAIALLEAHATILHGRMCIDPYGIIDTHLEDVAAFPPLSVSWALLKPPLAPRLRLALDLLNTLCACDGFDPVQNQRFWRRVVLDLLVQNPVNVATILDHELPPFDALAFSRFEFGMCPMWIDSDANEYWHGMISCGVLIEDAADVHREREVLAQRLAACIVRPVRSLALSMSLGPSDHRIPVEEVSETLTTDTVIRCTSDLQRQRQAAATMGFDLPLFSPLSALRLHITPRQLMAGFIRPIHAPFMLQQAQRLLRAGELVTMDSIVLGGMPCSLSRRPCERLDTVAALGRLLRVDYFGDKMIRSFKLLVNSYTFQTLGALLSVIPHKLQLDNAEVWWCPQQEKLLGHAWLAYALYHPKRRPEKKSGRCLLKHVVIHLSGLNSSEVQYVNALVRSGTPLRDVVGVVLHNRYGAHNSIQVDCLSLGVTAVLPQGTPVYYEPGRNASPYELTTLDRTETLDVVAHLTVEGFLGVVYPGFGLVWSNTRLYSGNRAGTPPRRSARTYRR